MTNQKKVATSGQLSAVGFKIAGTVTRLLGERNFGFEEANHLILNDEKTLEKLTEKFCEEILGIKVDPWTEEKRRVEKFYKKFFNRTIDWSKIVVPLKKEGMNRLEVIFSDITEDDAFNAYIEQFGKHAVFKYYDSITKSINEQQKRPKGNYAITHVGGDESDMLDSDIEVHTKFMVPKEGIIAAFRYRTETGKIYDVKGLTRFASLDNGGDDMFMYRNDDGGRFGISRSFGRFAPSGLRQVSF